MDDLTQQLQKVLSDPQTMGQLQGLLSSLGGQEEKPAPAPSGGPAVSYTHLTLPTKRIV